MSSLTPRIDNIESKHFYFSNTDSSFNISTVRQNSNTSGALFTVNDTLSSPAAKMIRITASNNIDLDLRAFETYTGAVAGNTMQILNSSGTQLVRGSNYFNGANGEGGGVVSARLYLLAGDYVDITVTGQSGSFTAGGINLVANKVGG